MSEADQAFRHLLLNVLEEASGTWVNCLGAHERFTSVGCVVAVRRDTMTVELQTLSGGRFVAPVGVFLAVYVLGPEDQTRLSGQLATTIAAARRVLQ